MVSPYWSPSKRRDSATVTWGSRDGVTAPGGRAAQRPPLGVRRVWLVTTNDNFRAATLYARRGYRLIRVHLNGMDAVRRVKPGVPDTGFGGLPIRDIWEFEKSL